MIAIKDLIIVFISVLFFVQHSCQAIQPVEKMKIGLKNAKDEPVSRVTLRKN
jgi:hypothetical protein